MDLLDLISPFSRKVVEFSCADGALGKRFLERVPSCRYIGIENDEKLRESAAACLTEAVEEAAFRGRKNTDALVFSARALGMLTPSFLEKQAAFLSEDGTMLFELPNISYLPRVLGILAGKGERYMTPAVLLRMLQEMGFSIEFYQELDQSLLQQKPEILQKLETVLKDTLTAYGESLKNPYIKRYFVIARKKAAEKIFVHTMIGEEIVTARLRLKEPHAFLKAAGVVEAVHERGRYTLNLSKDYPKGRKICIRQRLAEMDKTRAKNNFERLRENGEMVLFELDDSLTLFDHQYRASDYIDFVGAHAVLVSTENLRKELLPYNPHVYVLENSITRLPKLNFREEKEITIFYGALNRTKDFAEILPVLNKVAKKYKKKLHFKFLADAACYEALQAESKEFIQKEGFYDGKFVPYAMYEEALASSDIALLPLLDTEFNCCKSDLKFLEAAANSTAVLASPVAYENSIEDGKTGLIYHNLEEFEEKLTALIEDADLRRSCVENAYQYVQKNRMMYQAAEKRLQLYRALLADYDQLDAEAVERVSKL